MAAYVSANSKYYSKSHAAGEMGHVNRLFETNSNVIPHPQNIQWSDGNLYQKFLGLVSKAEGIRGKKFQHNSNLFIDTVVALSRDRVDELRNTLKEDFKVEMAAAIGRFEVLFQEHFGFTPIGSGFHGDEGHIHSETREFLRNYHFHVQSLNFDFETERQPLRSMKKADWIKVQDLVGEAFSPLGFERGVSKEITGKDHQEKDKYVSNLLASQELEIESNEALILEQKATLRRLDLANSNAMREADEIRAAAMRDANNETTRVLNLISKTMQIVQSIVSESGNDSAQAEHIRLLNDTFLTVNPEGVKRGNAIQVLTQAVVLLGDDLRTKMVAQLENSYGHPKAISQLAAVFNPQVKK
jgi:hypothetical protein